MRYRYLILILFSLIYNTLTGSDIVGGEISWRCLSNGQYVFYMQVYRDCTGYNTVYKDEFIQIVGNPLPSGGLDSILLNPDSVRWRKDRYGDTSPNCSPNYGNEYSCVGQDDGTIQVFYYKSVPFDLIGTPPKDGWKFFWEAACCRSGRLANVESHIGGNLLLRAIMYPGPNGISANPCYDSSPIFRALPATLICRNYEFTYNHTALDMDLDKLIYTWDISYNSPAHAPVPLHYKQGYSFDNPTPDESFNVNNIPASLDRLTGISRLAVYSGRGTKKYLTVVRVDSYRKDTKVATVFREIPISFFDCPTLPNGAFNYVPEVTIAGAPAQSAVVDIVAGQTASIPVQVIDNDITGIGSQLQVLTLVPNGLLFTNSKLKNFPCEVPGLEPCAYLRNADPFLNTMVDPNTIMIQGLGIIGTEFVWSPQCKHISSFTGTPGTNEGIYNFVMRVFDDHCPIPALNYPTITVRVRDPIPMTEPIVKGISVNLDGSTTVNYAAPIDSTNDLGHFEIQSCRTLEGANPIVWRRYDSNIKSFFKDHTEPMKTFPIYDFMNPLDALSGPKMPDLLGTRNGVNFDFYVRMRSISGCTDTIPSDWSQAAKVMELELTPIGTFPDPINSKVRLSWNRSKPLTANTYPYYEYESQTIFNIWVNDSVSQNKLADPTAWYKVGSTSGTTFELNATNCNDFVAYRVEAVDSMGIIKQGAGLNQPADSILHLNWSTFSTIDTMKMNSSSFIPYPKLDTLEARANGELFIKIDLENKATTSHYNIYEGDAQSGMLLTTVNANQDSILLHLPSIDSNRQISIEAIDGCDTNNIMRSNLYSTFSLNGNIGAACSGEYIINWHAPYGFPIYPQPNVLDTSCNGIKGFRVYVDSISNGAGNNYELLSTLMGSDITTDTLKNIKRSTTYLFKVVAFDCENAVIISTPYIFHSPATISKPILVPPPTPRCTYVNDDGTVKLSWIPPVDSLTNFGAYQIEYRIVGTQAWIDFPAANTLDRADDNIIVRGINAQTSQYEFRLTTLAGCDGTIASTYNMISSVFIAAVPRPSDPLKRGDIMWNPTGVDYGNFKFFSLYKGEDGIGYGSPFFTSDVLNTNMAMDNENGAICDNSFNYYVAHSDSLYKQRYGFSCQVRSNLATARYQDTIAADPHDLLYVSYNLSNNGVNAYWANSRDRRMDSLKIITKDGLNSGLQNYISLTEVMPIHDILSTSMHEALIPHTVLDARNSSMLFASRTIDACGNEMPASQLYFHKTMDVSVEWNICDSVNEIKWNAYVGFKTNHRVNYQLYYRIAGTDNWQTASAIIQDTSFNHRIILTDTTYEYHVRAFTTETPSFVSNSNIEDVYVTYRSTPRYSYLKNVTVLPSNEVEIHFYRDSLILGRAYNLYRGIGKNNLHPVASVSSSSLNNSNTIIYTDETAEVSKYRYFYQVITENACNFIVDESNIGTSIQLSVYVDNAGMVNELRWNQYQGWDSTVAYYNIYKGVDEYPSGRVFAVASPVSNYNVNRYRDDVYNELLSEGKFCYKVEAVQGPVEDVLNGFPHDFKSAFSSSNTVCVVVKPLFYVPNAFVPGGVNHEFKPKGQFFDLTNYEMIIYSRWGEQVFSSRDANSGWNGTINGKEVELGSYVYIISFRDAAGNEHRRKGTVTLIK